MPNARPAQVRVAIIVAATLLIGCTPGPSPAPSGGGSSSDASEPPPPSSGPSLAPIVSPSPVAIASVGPLRTAVQVNAPVIERPGVPSDIATAYWWTGDGDAGQLGTTAQVGLPAGERIDTIAGGLIVAVRTASTGGTGPSHLIIRDAATGALLRDVTTPIWGPTAVIAGRLVFWGGTILAPGGLGTGMDGGLWALDPRAGHDPILVVPGGEKVATVLGGRTRLKASPSGRTVAGGLVSFDGTLRTDIIDVSTLRVRNLAGGLAFAATDDIFVSDDQEPTDAPFYGYGITATSIATGAVQWRFPAAGDVDKFALQDIVSIGNDILVSYAWQTGSTFEDSVARIDSRTGKAEVLFREDGTDGLAVHLDVSSARHIVLADDVGSLGDLIENGDTWISVFDTATGALARDAFLIHTPFMCTEAGCRQGG